MTLGRLHCACGWETNDAPHDQARQAHELAATLHVALEHPEAYRMVCGRPATEGSIAALVALKELVERS